MLLTEGADYRVVGDPRFADGTMLRFLGSEQVDGTWYLKLWCYATGRSHFVDPDRLEPLQGPRRRHFSALRSG